MRKKILIYGLAFVIFASLCIVSKYNTTAQTKYKGILRGHQIQLEVKSTDSLEVGIAVQWDSSKIILFARSIRSSGDHLTKDSTLHDDAGVDSLAIFNSVFGIKGYVKGKQAGSDTVIIYGDTVKDYFYSTSGIDNSSAPDTIIFTKTQLYNPDSSFSSTLSYSDIDSIVVPTSSTTFDSIYFFAIRRLYVSRADSATVSPGRFAGIVVETIEKDTTGWGVDSVGAPGDSSSGMIAISGFAKALLKGSVESGDPVSVNLGGKLTPSGTAFADTTSIGISLETFHSSTKDTTRNIWIKLK